MPFLAHQQIQPAIQTLIRDSAHVALAVAFWGEGAKQLLEGGDPERQSVRLLCDLEMGATNPGEVAALAERFPFAHVPGLHAKVYLGDERVIAGSANISANGLGLERREVSASAEAALESRAADDVRAAWAWFEQMWAESTWIRDDPAALERARRQRERSRPYRPRPPRPGRSLLDLVRDQPEAVAGRLYFAVVPCRHRTSAAAEEATEQVAPEHPRWEVDSYKQWQGINELPQDAEIVELWYDAGGRLHKPQIGHYQLLEGGPRHYEDGEDGDGFSIRICGTVETPQDTLSAADIAQLRREPLATSIWQAAYPASMKPFDPDDEGADKPGVIPADQMSRLLRNKPK